MVSEVEVLGEIWASATVLQQMVMELEEEEQHRPSTPHYVPGAPALRESGSSRNTHSSAIAQGAEHRMRQARI